MSVKEFSKFGQAYVSYGSYHHNVVNKWIHIFCVPLIAATLIVGFSYVPLNVELQGYKIGIAEVMLAVTMAYYFSLNAMFAIGMTVLSSAIALAWNQVFSSYEEGAPKNIVLGIHIVSWILQFVGHGVFQKRKPALFDSLSQVLNAPLFVVVEILQMLGLKSAETDLWNAQILDNITELRKKDKAK